MTWGGTEWKGKAEEQALWLNIKASVEDSWHTCIIWPCLYPDPPVYKVEIMNSITKHFVLKMVLGIIGYRFPEMSMGIWNKSINIIVFASLNRCDCFSGLGEEYFIDSKDVWGWHLGSWFVSGSALDQQQNRFTVSG